MADLDPVVSEAIRRTETGRKEHDTRIQRYNRSYDIYRASEPRSKGVEVWQSKLRVPYARQTIDTALVNLVGGVPRCLVHPRRPDDVIAAKAMQMVLDYYTAEDHLAESEAPFVQQGLIYGVTAAKVHWLYREGQATTKDEKGNPTTVEVVKRDGPTFEPWNVYQVYWEPGARDVDSAAYVVLQSYLSKDELLQQQYNPETGQGLYHNLDQLFASGAAPQPKNTAQDRANRIPVQSRFKDKFLIEEIWRDESVTVLGNRQVLIRGPQPNPYWHGKKPVVISQVRPDLFEMQGISETDLIHDLQQALWTIQNMRFDNLHLTVMRGITYREGGVTDINQLELRPRFKWPVQDQGDIQPFEVQPLPPEAYGEENALLQRMQLVTGINPYVSGADMSGVDQNTATGVTALQGAASKLLRFFATQLQHKGFQRAYEMWGADTQQFLDKNLYLKITGQDGWVEVTPQDVIGEFKYGIEGAEDSLSRQQDRAEATAFLNAMLPYVQLQAVNPKPIIEKVAALYGFDNPDELLPVAGQPQAPAAPIAPQPQQQPPQQQPSNGGTNVQSIQQLLGGQQLNPAVQQAIQAGR